MHQVAQERELRRRAELQLASLYDAGSLASGLSEMAKMMEYKDTLIHEISKERDFLKKEVVPVLEHTIKLYEKYRKQMEQELEAKNKELEYMRNTENSLEDPILETDEEDSVHAFNFDLFFNTKDALDADKVTRSLCSSPNSTLPKGLASRPVSSMRQIPQLSKLSPRSSNPSVIPTSKHKILTKLTKSKTIISKPSEPPKKFTPSFLRVPKATESSTSRAHRVLTFPTKKLMSSTRNVFNNP